MSPSASMLFLSYHQLHHGPAADAEAEAAPRDGGFRFGFRNVLFPPGFLAAPTRQKVAPAVAPGPEVKQQRGLHAGGDHRAENDAALDSKFEEAVRLSCWSS